MKNFLNHLGFDSLKENSSLGCQAIIKGFKNHTANQVYYGNSIL